MVRLQKLIGWIRTELKPPQLNQLHKLSVEPNEADEHNENFKVIINHHVSHG